MTRTRLTLAIAFALCYAGLSYANAEEPKTNVVLVLDSRSRAGERHEIPLIAIFSIRFDGVS